MTTKHTPGPLMTDWHHTDDVPRKFKDEPKVWPILICVASGSGKGSEIAAINHDENNDPEDAHSEESWANAHLFTAAPDLLSACKATLAFLSAIKPNNAAVAGSKATISLLTAAIAKAEGREGGGA